MNGFAVELNGSESLGSSDALRARPVVLVLTVPLGGGHTAAAKAITSVLTELAVRAEVVDLAAEIFERFPFDKLIRMAYKCFSTWWGGRIHAVLYDLADRYPAATSRLTNFLLGPRVARWSEGLGPVDVFISTFPLVSYVLARRLPSRRRPGLVSFVTDAGEVNRVWFQGDVDRFIVSGLDTSEFAKMLGVPADRITVARPPIASGDTSIGKAEARGFLGLDERFTILLTSGGSGLGRGVLEAAELLMGSNLDVQFILNAGDNERLYRRFRALSGDRRCLVVGFTHDFPLMLAACDLVVGKAGWLTINEAMAIRRPTLIVDVLPGQEEANCAYAESQGAGRRIRPKDVPNVIQEYLSSNVSFNADFTFDRVRGADLTWPSELRKVVKDMIISREVAHV